MKVHRIDTDVLIIGSGIAGLKAALEVTKAGKECIVVSKYPVGKATNTTLGGGAFSVSTDKFSPEEHMQKTLNSGRMLNNRELVERFVNNARSDVQELVNLGLKAHFHDTGFRCLSPYLVGGPMITKALVKAVRGANIRCVENIMITDLMVTDKTCRGAVGFHKENGEWYGFQARAVILATGGAGAIYARNDNTTGATGDGYALALLAGLELMDMEFVQFYPLVYAGSGRARMILPSYFGDAGNIINRRGEDLKDKYSLPRRLIATVTRDQLAQALFREIKMGNDVDGAIILDMRQADRSTLPLSDDLLELYKKKTSYDTKPLKIAPACHHTMGGILIDADGHTELKGLFAAGEVTGGIHGANRMGGNAYSEALVFGGCAARAASREIADTTIISDFEGLVKDCAGKWNALLNTGADKRSEVFATMENLKQVLWEKAGIIRDEASLQEGIEKTGDISGAVQSLRARNINELYRIVECRNAVLTGLSIALAAIERKESRGSHYREDYPAENKEWERHVYVAMKGEKPAVSRIIPAI
ncbi:MAG: FAD-binding protein [Deltaproteobacteria bacterium]|nr:FAD-binding protein [Deltaproteobacteria bacterium]